MGEAGIIPTLEGYTLRYANTDDLNDLNEFPFIYEHLPLNNIKYYIEKSFQEGLSTIGETIFEKHNYKINEIVNWFQKSSEMIAAGYWKILADLTKKRHVVCCFSSTLDSPAMWGYYAGNASGAAIGFDADFSYMELKKVNYVITPPTFHPVYMLSKGFPYVNLLITKSFHWQHENEYRLVYPRNILKFLENSPMFGSLKSMGCHSLGFLGTKDEEKLPDYKKHLFMHFHTSSVKEVCFAVGASDSFKRKIFHILSDPCYKNVKIYQMRYLPDSYQLEKYPLISPQPINISTKLYNLEYKEPVINIDFRTKK